MVKAMDSSAKTSVRPIVSGRDDTRRAADVRLWAFGSARRGGYRRIVSRKNGVGR
jgi:hypothetical protein